MSQDVAGQGSLVAGTVKPGLTNGAKFGIAGLVLAVSLGFIWIRYFNTAATPKHDSTQQPATFTTGQDFRSGPPPTTAAPPPPALPMPAALRAPYQPMTYSVLPPRHQVTPAESAISAYSGALPPLAPSGQAGPAAPARASAPSAPPSALAVRLKPTVVEPTKATMLPHPDFLLTEGTVIPCTLQTAIDSELPGFVKCVIPQDIRGTTGNVVLLDKGTQVIGEIQRGLLYGQDRIFVLWTRAETPQHAVIALDSPGTDALGRSGLPGTVDDHFWKRFGSAIMLSVVQGGLQAGSALAASAGHGSTNSVVLNSFSGNGQQLADTALQASLNVPPTLEKNQGDNVAIFVARDLDFSDIYKLRLNGYGDAR